jgi:hypothetical protein
LDELPFRSLQKIKAVDFVTHEQMCYKVVTPKPKSAVSTSQLQQGNVSAYLSQATASATTASTTTASTTTGSSLLAQVAKSGNRTANRYTFKCPYCVDANLSLEELRGHCNQYHPLGQKEVVCPVCAAMPWGMLRNIGLKTLFKKFVKGYLIEIFLLLL